MVQYMLNLRYFKIMLHENVHQIKIRNYGTRAQNKESPGEKFEAQNTNKIC